jgi:hypothetical protein
VVPLDDHAPPAEEHQELLETTPAEAGWALARELDGLQAYTRVEPGLFAFRVRASVPGTAPAEWVVLMREFDLMPQWLTLCDGAQLLRLASPTHLWALATFSLPWYMAVLPPLFVLLHVRLHERTPGEWLASCTSATDDEYDRATLPHLKRYSEVPVECIARLAATPHATAPAGEGGAAASGTRDADTSVDAIFRIRLSRLTFLGPARHAMSAAPAWLVQLAASVIIPFLWKAFVGTLTTKVAHRHGADARSSPWVQRLRADETGLYAMMARRHTAEPGAAQRRLS